MESSARTGEPEKIPAAHKVLGRLADVVRASPEGSGGLTDCLQRIEQTSLWGGDSGKAS